MIAGSRYDAVATELTASWPGAALCAADDLVRPGWVWRHGHRASRRWLVDGHVIRDREVTGVFVRRSAVYAEELRTTHPEDRAFVAAEAHAFLTFVLGTTAALVVNPVIDGAFGEEAIRPERWMAAAASAGVNVRPVAVTSELRRSGRVRSYEVEVAGKEVFGDAPPAVLKSARRLVNALSLYWAVLLFDSRDRLMSISSARPPGPGAAAALGRALSARRR